MNLLLFNLKTDANDTVLGFTTDWINALAGHCKHITVITMMAGKIAVAHNVQVLSVGKEKGWSEPRRAVEFYKLLAQVLLTNRFDACFAHMMPLFAVMGWPLLRLLGIPITLWYAHSHVSPLLKLATVLVDRVVSPSINSFRIETPKLYLIGHGIDTERFAPRRRNDSNDRFTVITVGRISPIKRIELLLEALALLKEDTRKKVYARIIGDPVTDSDKAYLQYLEKKRLALGVQDIIDFLPGIEFARIHTVYQEGDMFVNCSDTDSLDKSILEAMSSGLPVVTSNVALQDVVDPAMSQLLLTPKGNPQLLADRLDILVRMPEAERHALGIRLRDTVKKGHSLPTLIDRLACILRG